MSSPTSAGTTAHPSLTEGTVIADKYRIDGVIGQGGMGVVLRATHLQLDQTVAIKVVKQDVTEVDEIVARMLIEARAAASIKSEHVARVLDVARLDDGTPYIVMEYLEGQDLFEVLGERVQLSVADTVDYVLQACEALAEAHAAGIVHRDLKPENLFLHRTRDGSHVVKVLDFGISKTTQATSGRRSQMALTSAHGVVGSVHYMAPEQMRALPDIDARADIYALGSILFELLTGAPPFDADSVPEVCARVLGEPPPPICAVRPDVPPEVEAIVARCLEKDRDHRFANVAELADELALYGTQQARRSAGRISRVLLGKPSPVADADGTGAFAAARTAGSDRTTNHAAPAPPRALASRRGLAIAIASSLAVLALVVVYLSYRRPILATPPVASRPGAEPARPAPVAAPSETAPSTPSVTVADVVAPAASSAPTVDTAPPRHPPPPTRPPSRPAKPRPSANPYDINAFGGRR